LNVSIIIVNYNTKDLLYNCLKSIYDLTENIEFEVIVSDNGSLDGSVEMLKKHFTQVTIIENNANLGFGTANNRALDIAKGEYIFYLNSDTVLLNNAVKNFYDYWEKSTEKDSLGALGCTLYNEEMKIIHSYDNFPTVRSSINELKKIFLNTTMKSFFRLVHYDYKHLRKEHCVVQKTGEVDYVTGADLFLKNDNFARFDERYFLFFEETDMQIILKDNSKKRIIIDGPRIIHLCGGSNKVKDDFDNIASFTNIQMCISRIKYLKKNTTSNIGVFIVKALTILILLNPILFSKTKKYISKIVTL